MASSSSAATDTPSPPPPTPSNDSLSRTLSVDDDALSRLLDQLLILSPAPSLSRPPRLNKHKSVPVAPATAPLVSLLQPSRALVANALTNLGFFHLADHGIPPHLPSSALLECSNSLFGSPLAGHDLSSLGFDADDDDEGGEVDTFLVFDTSSDKLDSLPETREYARSLGRVGLEVVEMIFPKENPFRKGSVRPRCLLWISEASSSSSNGDCCHLKKSYPYVVCLQYEVERKPSWMVNGDSGGRIAVEPLVGSVLVTVGDIAKVWSNGRFKRVRGIPDCNPLPPGNSSSSQSVSMSILVTLPIDSVVSPLLPRATDDGDAGAEHEETRTYREFPFEEYAWRVHHDQLPFKDPLLRYKI
ncbi:uncharacterized protein M6B38_387135 [Iris pallida]|uniref:Uncharacterized protein n=1 Tax=Iris pallida TaxID=29817 RepID=A0AAX6G1T7_IRIPA|nr:uncharacterized protein M6B38_387135 [Iris pallida]